MPVNLEKYYQYLKSAGADTPPTFESFSKTLSDEASAKTYYNYLRTNKFDAPDTFDSFARTLGVKKKDGGIQGPLSVPSLSRLAQDKAQRHQQIKGMTFDQVTQEYDAKADDVLRLTTGKTGLPDFASQYTKMAELQQSREGKVASIAKKYANTGVASKSDFKYLAEAAPIVAKQLMAPEGAKTIDPKTPITETEIDAFVNDSKSKSLTRTADFYRKNFEAGIQKAQSLMPDLDPNRFGDDAYITAITNNLRNIRKQSIDALEKKFPIKTRTTLDAPEFGGAVTEQFRDNEAQYKVEKQELDQRLLDIDEAIKGVSAAAASLDARIPGVDPKDVGMKFMKFANPELYANRSKTTYSAQDRDIMQVGVQLKYANATDINQLANIREEENVLDDRSPEKAVADTYRRLAAELYKGDNWLYNRDPSDEELEKAAQQLPDYNRNIYEKHIKGKRGFLSQIPQSGAINQLSRQFENTNFQTVNFLKRLGGQRVESDVARDALDRPFQTRYEAVGANPADVKRLKDLKKLPNPTTEELNEIEDLETFTNVRSKASEIIDGSFGLAGQVLYQALMTRGVGGGLFSGARSLGIAATSVAPTAAAPAITAAQRAAARAVATETAASSIASTAVSGGLTLPQLYNVAGAAVAYASSYDAADQDAMSLFPDDPEKRKIYASTVGSLNALSERIFKDEKIFDAFKRQVAPNVARLVEDISTKKLSETLVANRLKDIIKGGMDFVKLTTIENVKETTEEVATSVGTSVAKLVLAPAKFEMTEAIQDAVDTATMMFSDGWLVAAFAGAGAYRANRVGIPVMSQLGTNAPLTESVRSLITAQAMSGQLTPQQAAEKMRVVNTIAATNQNDMEMLAKQTGLAGRAKQKYAIALAHEKLLMQDMNNTQDAALKAQMQSRIKESEALRRQILNKEVFIDKDYRAITPEQAAREKKAQEDAAKVSQGQGGVPQGGGVQPTGTQAGQPQTGPGTGGVGQAPVPQANASDRAVESQRRITQKFDFIQPTDFVQESYTPVEDEADRSALPDSGFANEQELRETLETGQYGIVSGMNPDKTALSKTANEELNKRAEQWLRERGLRAIRIFGKYGNTERSFMVPGMTRSQALEFAKEFMQEAVAHSTGMVYQDGTFNPRTGGVTIGPKFGQAGADNFSSINVGGNIIDFSVGYDFGTLEDRSFVSDLVDKRVEYKGKPALIVQDGQTLLAQVEGQDRMVELGNVDQLSDVLPEDMDIEVPETEVEGTEEGYNVGGTEYFNREANPLDAISRDPSGKVMNVTLTTKTGKRRKFRGERAEDLAYQITLREITKDNESRAEFEQFVDEQAGEEIAGREAEAAEQEAAAGVAEQVPQDEEAQVRAASDGIGNILRDTLGAVDSWQNILARAAEALRKFNLTISVVSNSEFIARGGPKNEAIFESRTGEILFNRDKLADPRMAGRIIWHETSHPIVNVIRNKNPELYRAMARGIQEMANRNTQFGEAVKDWAVNQYWNQYDEQGNLIIETEAEKIARVTDEMIVEAISYLAAFPESVNEMPRSVRQSIMEFVNMLAKMLGMNPVFTKADITRQDVAAARAAIEEIADILKTGRDAAGFVGEENVGFTENSLAQLSAGGRDILEKTRAKVVKGKTQPSMVVSTEKGSYAGPASMEKLRELQPKMYVNRAVELATTHFIVGRVRMFPENASSDRKLKWADDVYSKAMNTVVSNLLHIYDSIPPQIREISKLWYDGANIVSQVLSAKYGKTLEQTAAVIASQSPQKPWYANVHLAHFIMDFYETKQDMVLSQELFNYYKLKAEPSKGNPEGYPKQIEYLSVLEKQIGKKFSELDNYDRSIMIRADFDLNYERRPPHRLPNGVIVGLKKEMASHSGYDTIAKAISILEDGSEQNISDNLGEYFKVRNFNNNITDPSLDGEITSDTHAMAAAYLLPLGAKDKKQVRFDGASYSFFAEAYRRAAKERGVLAREMQSITWEGARSLFPDKKKNDKYKEIFANIWKEYKSGNVSLEETQKKIFDNAENIGSTDWSQHVDKLSEETQDSDYVGELSLASRDQSSVESGDGGVDSRGLPRVERKGGKAGRKQASAGGRNLIRDAKLDKFMTPDGKGNYVFFHYSGNRFKKLNPNKFGSNLVTGRSEQPGIGLSLFYTEPGTVESGVPADYGYAVKVPMDKVYPFNSDPLDLYDEAEAEFRKVYGPIVAFDANKQVGFMTKVAAKYGYPVTVADWSIKGRRMMRAQTTMPLPVEEFRKKTSSGIYTNPAYQGLKSNRQASAGNRKLTINKTEKTQSFFSDVVKGVSDKYKPKRPWEPMMKFSEGENRYNEAYEKFKGKFDEHIATSIPGFRDVQIKKGAAILNMLPKGGMVYDLGGSEGGFVKAITQLSDGKIESVNLDVNKDMKAVHEAKPVPNSRFVNEAFYEGYTEGKDVYVAHRPEKKADVVHESMLFQFISPDRAQFVQEIADNYVKPDGLVILEEKVVPDSIEEFVANEEKKDADFKLKYYDKSQLDAKQEEVLTGMKQNQTMDSDLVNELSSRFKYVAQYWSSGNFKGYVASNKKQKVDKFLKEVGDTSSEFSVRPNGYVQASAGGRNLAPNGKPSNLTPSQYAQVRTPEFKNWFGDWENDPENASKVVDENGEPMVVYHGTTAEEDFKTFMPTKRGDTDYYFFTQSAEFASEYANANMGRVIPVFLNAQKIFDPSNLSQDVKDEIFSIVESQELKNGASEDLAYERAYQFVRKLSNAWEDNWNVTESSIINKFIKDNDYDAINVRETGVENIAVLRSNQIKSATANIGAFSPTDARIQASAGGRMDAGVSPVVASSVAEKLRSAFKGVVKTPDDVPNSIGKSFANISDSSALIRSGNTSKQWKEIIDTSIESVEKIFNVVPFSSKVTGLFDELKRKISNSDYNISGLISELSSSAISDFKPADKTALAGWGVSEIAQAYAKAKSDGSNPALVASVERVTGVQASAGGRMEGPARSRLAEYIKDQKKKGFSESALQKALMERMGMDENAARLFVMDPDRFGGSITNEAFLNRPGGGGYFSPRAIPVAPIPGGEPKQLRDIIFDLAEGLRQKISFDKPKRALGSYNPSQKLVRIRYNNDLDVTAHEIGHSIDDEFGVMPRIEMDAAAVAELNQFAIFGSQPPANHPDPAAYIRGEGFAEFMRAYLVNPADTVVAAPNIARIFEAAVPDATLKNLKAFSDDIRRWAGLSGMDKIMSNVKMDPDTMPSAIRQMFNKKKSGDFTITWLDRFGTNFTDEFKVFEKAIDHLVGVQGIDNLVPKNDPEILLRLLGGFDAKFGDMMENGLIDENLERVMDDGNLMNVSWLLDPIADYNAEGKLVALDSKTLKDRMNAIVALMVAERTIELGFRFERADILSGIGGGIFTDFETAEAALNDLKRRADYDKLQEAVRRYRAMSDQVLQYMVAKGRLAYDEYDSEGNLVGGYLYIKQNNLQYVAMNRIQETEPGQVIESKFGSPKSLGSKDEILMAIQGSTKTIQNPYISMFDNVYRGYREADRNEVLLNFRNLLVNPRMMGEAGMRRTSDVGYTVSGPGKDVVTVFVNGKPEYWRLQTDLANAVKGIAEATVSLPRVFTLLPRMLRWTVTNFPIFALRNVVRDTQHRIIISNEGNVWQQVKALAYSKEDSDMAARTGALNAGHYFKSKEMYYSLLKDAEQAISKTGAVITAPEYLPKLWSKYQDFLYKGENANRIAEFKNAYDKAIKQGMDPVSAQLLAASKARSLIDFAVAGRYMKWINQLIPFSNAAVQGLRSAYNRVVESPGSFILRTAAFSVLPQVVLWALNHKDDDDEKEYEDLLDYQRDMFHNFKVGETWISIPKPFELGVVAAATDRALSYLNGYKDAYKGFSGTIAKSLFMFEESDLAGPAQKLIEMEANRDFFRDKTIIPPHEFEMDVEERKGASTASNLGKFISSAMKPIKDADPRMVDFFIRGQFSYFGNMAIKMSNLGEIDARTKFGVSDTGFAKEFSAYNSKSVQEVMKYAKRKNITTSKPYKAFMSKIENYFTITDPAERGEYGRQLIDESKTVLKDMEQYLLDKKTKEQREEALGLNEGPIESFRQFAKDNKLTNTKIYRSFNDEVEKYMEVSDPLAQEQAKRELSELSKTLTESLKQWMAENR